MKENNVEQINETIQENEISPENDENEGILLLIYS